ncbi:hypothetical protein NKG99_04075 [Mesorhizobium sp. M1409]|uniref:hypothetical protein n=1 Tax=Mesorhizobium sp. M1409 TaxID=2957100 RepID=UPI0033359C25
MIGDLIEAPACRECGCTQNNACVTNGVPCHWVEPDLCSVCAGKPDVRGLAIISASQAADALAELLRFAREGDGLTGPFQTDVVEQLLDAAKMAMEVEGYDTERPERAEVYAAIVNFLDGWA